MENATEIEPNAPRFGHSDLAGRYMHNDRKRTEVITLRGAQASGLRIKLMATLLLAAVFSAGLLLGQSRLAGSKTGETRNAAESRAGNENGEQKLEANQVRLSPEAIRRGQIDVGAVSMHPFSQTIEAPGRLALNEDAAARV